MNKSELKAYGFKATEREQRIIDAAQQIHYNKGQSEIIRMLIGAGAEKIIGNEKAQQIKKETE